MAKKHRLMVLLMAGLFSVVACRLILKPLESGTILLTENFSSDENNWDIWYEENVSAVSRLHDEMVMIIEKPNLDIISTNQITYPDVQIRVSARKEFGSDNNIIGLVCRYLDENNFYSFLISSDGYFGVAKVFKGDYHLLSSENMEYSEVINQGNGVNTLSVTCSGSDLHFSVNMIELVSLSDADLNAGKNGLLVGSFEDPEKIVVAFDDFSVKVP